MQVSQIPTEFSITVFTDGSCHNQLKTGGWASIIFVGKEKITLKGHEAETTHHRMELVAVLEAMRFLQKNNHLGQPVTIYSDSQYVVDLLQRRERLTTSGFRTKKLRPIRNADLVQLVLQYIDAPGITLVKLKSHLRSSTHESLINREVDMLSREMMRIAFRVRARSQ
jgi:ribonuclease HI